MKDVAVISLAGVGVGGGVGNGEGVPLQATAVPQQSKLTVLSFDVTLWVAMGSPAAPPLFHVQPDWTLTLKDLMLRISVSLRWAWSSLESEF